MARLAAALALFPLIVAGHAVAEEPGRVEVVEVKGIIDSSVERAISATIEQAERDESELVILQIDSKGVLGRDRTQRLAESLVEAPIPVVAWIGPPGAEAADGAMVIALAADFTSLSARSRSGVTRKGLIRGVDLREADGYDAKYHVSRLDFGGRSTILPASSISDILDRVSGATVRNGDRSFTLSDRLSEAPVRFHKLDLLGRVLHGAAQPSITYLLLLLALVGIVFELFHPSTGPAGIAGLAALALAVYGVVTLGASWLGFGLIVAGVALFCVDLRFSSLGPLTAAGFAGLVAGSLLLFRGPWLRVSPWVLAFGIVSMVLFLLGAMTRVLRDLRAVARGELEVREAHPE